MDDGHVLVIGSSGMDVKGRPSSDDLVWGSPNLGQIRTSVGGVARNIAENLARLEVPTVLLTAVGKDAAGRHLLKMSVKAGIDMSHVRVIPRKRTSTYLALLQTDGQLKVAVSDFEVIAQVDSDYLLEKEFLFRDALMVVIDATLTPETLATAFALAKKHGLRVAADPTTPALAARLCDYMDQLYLIVPNAAETAAMCGYNGPTYDRDTALEAARDFVALGAEIAVVTMGADGLAYADAHGGGYLRAIHTKVVNSTGAGDAFSGAAIFGLLNGVPVDEAMRLGITAASLTLESRHTVLPKLNQELLYKKLAV